MYMPNTARKKRREKSKLPKEEMGEVIDKY